MTTLTQLSCPFSTFRHAPDCTSHILTDLSHEPETTNCPCTATALIVEVWPLSVLRQLPDAVSQILSVLSLEPEMSNLS